MSQFDMQLIIKSIVLKDKSDTVMGYVELRVENGATKIRVGHNYSEVNMMLSVSSYSGTQAFPLFENEEEFTLNEVINTEREIFAILLKRENGEILSLASGVVNMEQDKEKIIVNQDIWDAEVEEKVVYKRKAENENMHSPHVAKEIDELLRSVCAENVHDIHNCKDCPYRQQFFQA